MSSIYILWQDQITKLWHPVAKLVRENDLYRLNYTKGATASKGFLPFPQMEELDRIYESDEIFPFFNNRILPKSRPEFKSIIGWLDLNTEFFDPLEYLGVTSGQRKTDNYRILKVPELVDGKYTFNFLISGVQYLDDKSKSVISNLGQGSELEYFFETDNEIDQNAIKLLDKITGTFVGYCPRYLVSDFKVLLGKNSNHLSNFKVKKLNLDAPASYRLVCTFESEIHDKYIPLVMDEYLAHTIVHNS